MATAAQHETAKLPVSSRRVDGSRAARRLRRSGRVPGVIYGGDGDPVAFEVDGLVLRHALAGAGAILEVSLDDGAGQPVLVKDHQRHPVSGATVHLDLLRVRLDEEIQATVTVELVGGEEAPGVKVGGILDQITREVTIEALPNAIPDSITHDVSGLEINDVVTLAALAAPEGVTLLGDLEETVLATVAPPRVEEEPEEELEEETERVGEEGEEAAEGEAAAPEAAAGEG